MTTDRYSAGYRESAAGNFLQRIGMKSDKKQITVDWRIGPVSERKSTQLLTGKVSKRKEGEASMSLIMTTVQECPLQVVFKDSQGNPAPVENIVWTSSDENIITVTTDASDPTKAVVAATGTTGTGQVNVQADARVGSGTNEITGLLDVEILSAEATVVEISAGTPVDKANVEPVRLRKK